jgi:hypothetical protein
MATGERRGVQRRALMTQLATQAMDLADTFNVMFEARFVGMQVRLAKPGMSTAGGKHAVQHIALEAAGGGSLVVGNVDTGSKRAELRSHDRLVSMHRQRFGTELGIAEAEWMAFLDLAEKFLQEEGMVVAREAEAAGSTAADFGQRTVSRPPGRAVPVWLAIVLALVLAVIAIAATVLITDGQAPPPPPGAPVMPMGFPVPMPSSPPGTPAPGH